MNPVLQINNLTKKYPKLFAVKDLNLSIEKGSVFGLLGPNGSGKTTTLSIILGATNPTAGSFSWFGETNKSKDRKKIGALLETPNFYDYLTAENNLRITAKIKGVNRQDINRVAKLVNLEDRLSDKFSTYSLGMKQRLAIAAALLGNPEVLILDEPTNGLDPQGIAEIRNVIQQVSKNGVTILLASHALDEVEKVCTHVCVIKNGESLVQGNVKTVIKGENLIEVSSVNKEALRKEINAFTGTKSIKEENHYFVVSLEQTINSSDFNAFLISRKIVVNHFVVKKKSLEEFFLETTSND